MKTLADWKRTARDSKCLGPFADIVMDSAWHMLGAIEFAKIPVLVPLEHQKGPYPPNLERGTRRPIECPESAKEGWRFYLTWTDGVEWIDDTPEFPERPCLMGDRFSGEEARQARTEAYFSVEKNDSFFHESTGAREDFVRVRQAWARGDFEEVMASAFEAGRKVGRGEAIARLRPQMERLQELDRRTDWTKVIHAAQDRHGSHLTPLQLLKAMGGSFEKEKVPNADGTISFREGWRFPNGQVIDQDTFQAAHKQATSRKKK